MADIIPKSGGHIMGFLDGNVELPEPYIGYTILGTVDAYKRYTDAEFIIAIGNTGVMETINASMEGVVWYTAILASAVISDNVEKDFQAPKQLGMRSVYFKNEEGLYSSSEEIGIREITEIENMI